MNKQDAERIMREVKELEAAVFAKLPKTINVKRWPDDEDSEIETYELCSVKLPIATYRRYVGCNEYDFHSEYVNFNILGE